MSERQSKDFPWLYHRNGGGVHMRRWVNHGPLRTLVSMVLPENKIISQGEARASAARIGRLIAIDPEVEATYATATH